MFVSKNIYSTEAGNDNGGSSGPSVSDLQKQIADLTKAMDGQTEELDRLRTHSSKLLDEKKKLQKDFKAFENLGDPEVINNMLKQFENNEDAKLVAEGKFNEVLQKHTERQQLEFKSKLEELGSELQKSREAGSTYERLFHESEAGHAIRQTAVAAGVRETAVDDILLRGKGLFTVSDDGTLEARDKEGNLRTIDGKALTPELFVAGLRDKYPHYWPDSQGGGARGGAGKANQPNPFKRGSKEYSLTEQAKIRRTDPQLAEQLAAEAQVG